MAKQNVTLSIESSVWEKYKEVEKEPSSRVEEFMTKELKKNEWTTKTRWRSLGIISRSNGGNEDWKIIITNSIQGNASQINPKQFKSIQDNPIQGKTTQPKTSQINTNLLTFKIRG